MKYPTLDQANLKGKRVVLRAGFDVPIENGKVVDDTRILAVIPTVKHLLEQGASVVIIAHQGRPMGKHDKAFSQQPLVPVLRKLLKIPVKFAPDCTSAETRAMAASLKPGEVLLLENVRFDFREECKDPPDECDALGKELAALGDVYVNEAFTNSHRDHASMTRIPKYIPGYLGFNAARETEGLLKALDDPRRPVVLIISGAKIETKVPVIRRFLDHGDEVLVGGIVANTFIAARGFDVGSSKMEAEHIELCQELMLEADKTEKADIHVPRDVVVASEISESATKLDLPVEDVQGDMMILDIGKVTIERYKDAIAKAGTIVWNGPLGLYELNRFSHGTKRIAEAIKEATERGAVSIIGGGDTLDFHTRYDYPLSAYSFVSTAGGAMLDFISGKKLPALEVLKK